VGYTVNISAVSRYRSETTIISMSANCSHHDRVTQIYLKIQYQHLYVTSQHTATSSP